MYNLRSQAKRTHPMLLRKRPVLPKLASVSLLYL